MKKIIKLIDENFENLSGISLNLPTPVEWVRNVNEYEVAIYTDGLAFNQEIDETKINCVWLLEPPVINGEHQFKAIQNSKKFKYIFSSIKDLESKIDNFVYIPFGGTWLRENDILIHNKTKNISSIFSWKTWNHGHRLRHSLYNTFKETDKIDFYGSGCEKPIDLKIEGLQNYRFSISIENSIESDYFTEKLLDCFLSGTIPVYWGTPSVGKYFDKNGIIFIENEQDLSNKIDLLTEEFYNSKKESIIQNFELAKKYIHPEKLVDLFLNENL